MISRYEAIEIICDATGANDLLVGTTGMVSRELFLKNDTERNFYMIGSMGLVSAFGLGLALKLPKNRVLVIDGDGSVLMSMGTLALIATERPANLVHIVLDNESYESTGSQPSITTQVSLASVAKASGYKSVWEVDDRVSLQDALTGCDNTIGPNIILAKVTIDPIEDIPRVSHTPAQIRDRFRDAIGLVKNGL